MSGKKRLIIILLLLAATLAFVYIAFIGIAFFSAVSFALRQRADLGIGSPNSNLALSLTKKAAQQRSLTDADMVTLSHLSNDEHLTVRVHALNALFYLGGSPQAETAASIARAKLNDPEYLVRAYALSALSRLQAPDTKSVAQKMLNDPSAEVRKIAQTTISQGK